MFHTNCGHVSTVTMAGSEQMNMLESEFTDGITAEKTWLRKRKKWKTKEEKKVKGRKPNKN